MKNDNIINNEVKNYRLNLIRKKNFYLFIIKNAIDI